MASVTGFTTSTLSVRRALCEALRFPAVFAGLCLRDALALFEAVFVDREAVFAAVRPFALPALRDLDAAVFAGVLLRDDAALFFEALFFEALFFEAPLFFAAGRPRVLAALRDFAPAAFFADLAIHNSFDPTTYPCGPGAPTKASRAASVNAAQYVTARALRQARKISF